MKHLFMSAFMRDAGTEGGGGNPLPPSLTEISNPDYVPPTGDLTEAQKAAAAAEAEAARLAEEERKKQEAAGGAVEGLNEDGTLQEGYVRDADGNVVKETPAEGEEEDTFWEDVDKLHGRTITVEYPEGVDPLAPEGVYHREKAIMAQTVNDFEAHLKASDPRGYAYLLHRQAGGDDESFFSKKTFSLPNYEEFKDNPELHAKIYKQSLLAKNLPEDSIQVLVDKAIKDNKLFDYADGAYKAAEKEYADGLKEMEIINQRNQAEYTKSVTLLSQQLNESIVEGKGMNLIVPDTDKQPFLQFVKERIERENGKFVIVQPLEDDMHRQLEALYLLYKKGDLKALIQREAQTANVKKLGKVLSASKNNNKPTGAEPRPVIVKTLGEL